MKTIEDAIADHLAWLAYARGRSIHTLRAYRCDLFEYRKFTCSSGRGFFEVSTILAYLSFLAKERSAASRTLRRKTASLRGLFKSIVRAGRLDKSPFDEICFELPRNKALPRAISRSDASRLVRYSHHVLIDGNKRYSSDFAIAVLLLLSVGLRISELLGLQRKDFDEVDGALIVMGKGSRERKVFIADAYLRSKIKTLRVTSSNKLFFGGRASFSPSKFRYVLRKFAQDAGLEQVDITTHMLRHTAATLLLEDGVDLLFLQRLLGHENISTTALYAHVGNSGLRRALEKASLLSTLAA